MSEKIKQAKIYILIVQDVCKNVTLLAASKMILVIGPGNDSSTSGYAHRMEIRLLLNLTLVYITRTILGHPAVLINMKGSTPVDPAGPDCYQSGIKPCEST
jgi:hypothetical protein